MGMIHSIRPLLAVLTSLTAAFLILFTGEKHPNLREFWSIVASVTKFLIVLSILPFILNGKIVEYTFFQIWPHVFLQFRVDAFGMIFALLASSLWIAVSFYSIGYMRGLKEHAQTRFFFCFAIAIFSAVGVAMSGNLVTLYLFYEILTVSTFPLVAHKETPEAIKAGRKYLAYLLTGGCFALFSIGMTYYLTGSVDFVPGGFVAGHGSANLLRILFLTFMIGFGSKAAIMPLHEWLPSAMIAPTPVSALLHAVAVVKAGVFCCLRVILFVFGPKLLSDLNLWIILAYVVSFTIIVANLLAIAQDHLKKRLAFSTINNLSVIILGAALLSTDAIKGSMLHIAFHGFMKITLFLCAGAIYVKTHKEYISEMDGIGRQMPFTMAAFTIGALGLMGIPPVCGFISKWYLCLGSLEAKQGIFLFVFLTSAFLDAVYFLPIVFKAFFMTPNGVKLHYDEAPALVVAPLMATAIFALIFGLFPDALLHFFKLANLAVKSLSGG
ncbi:MAG: monovalent cation/H+ antiporter subunit D family protein [Candidatus Desulfofervidaceae bacterium]|nr:monovalent cation/H+ antiporter subunit D family protein [Candidatus Desulfofervidaceae bacterium]